MPTTSLLIQHAGGSVWNRAGTRGPMELSTPAAAFPRASSTWARGLRIPMACSPSER
ncbi:hypothetical protein [Myxococcus sp. RHSTA-1-4]|uniref:hypothetical protein n=1 Tax=Myxococcus sp. RHSTA-1-4 TaxID=2874601 RepID=UPI001CBB28A8|nr:hypothetical protein [Myxococcus sp. RHSTA-1-4]MBZ4414886.1 hypothetical protein [Myxococcus sp. RHSTA-1-4]